MTDDIKARAMEFARAYLNGLSEPNIDITGETIAEALEVFASTEVERAVAEERERVFNATKEAALFKVFSSIQRVDGGAIHMRDVRRVVRALTVDDVNEMVIELENNTLDAKEDGNV